METHVHTAADYKSNNDIKSRGFIRTVAGNAIFFSLWFLFFFAQGITNTDVTFADSPFQFQNVVELARETAGSAYKSPKGEVPDSLLNITYDEHRDIRFIPAKALWRREGLPFTVQFFHPGLYFDRTVSINTVDMEGNVSPVQFSKDLFDYKSKRVKDLVPKDLGFSGFRIHYPLNTKDYQDEVCVFLGASYFRAVGQHMNYGLSARGLAIDTYLPTGEEFPYFRKFWIITPTINSTEITFYALMDSPSLSGAYQFIVYPGKETVMDVKSTIFLRKKVQKLGVAPMTSMFFYGENSSIRPIDDFRPEIHDSDGLMLATGTGEWIWRPLVNPRTLLVTSFQTTNPKGFGLCQRDQDYEKYLDMESHYENRPSLWISPTSDWGEGRLELIQIHTEEEIHDNIVSLWIPSNLPDPGVPIEFNYRMSWHYFSDGMRPPTGFALATMTAAGKGERSKKFIVDFGGGMLESLPADKSVEAVISVSANAKLVEKQISKNRVNNRWRMVFEIIPGDRAGKNKILKDPIELRAFLKLDKDILTETWSYVYQP
ncbi:glucan biosynthesis protein, periplasmic [uncultured Desulfobacterium sp.]|uniref:Glucans biosynthesis protein G n=1 Tax=uncultured Desulfobacterium sp. TaxID=201089 RepID=A0A445N2Q2_9BACT|nr:glucan biosynthesis protein, periplasmic [uncultured Desulfobacterium sp.]